MDVESRNTLETLAFFEEKVPITPRDLAEDTINIDKKLLEKLKTKLEGKCSLHGWVTPNSVKILSRSMGYVESGRFTGDIVYHVQTQGSVINPPSGTIVSGQVIRKNKMGMYVDYKGAIRIILPRDLHIGNAEYEEVVVGQYVECEIKKSRFQVNDEYILSVGDFRGVSQSGKTARFTTRPPLLEKEIAPQAETSEVEEEVDEVEVVNNTAVPQGTVVVEEAQEGGSTDPILFSSKSPSFKEFSNFHKSKMVIDGKEWPTVEHFFQAQKFTNNPEYQEKIRAATTPAKAKSLGASRDIPIRNDWDSYREEVMKKGLNAKFSQSEAMKQLLVSTGNRPLVEDTNDVFWGQGRNKKGKNKLGSLLMELRNDLSAGK